jgi:hypothetical protein
MPSCFHHRQCFAAAGYRAHLCPPIPGCVRRGSIVRRGAQEGSVSLHFQKNVPWT